MVAVWTVWFDSASCSETQPVTSMRVVVHASFPLPITVAFHEATPPNKHRSPWNMLDPVITMRVPPCLGPLAG